MIIVAGHICLDVLPEIGPDARIAPGVLDEVGPAAFSVGGAVGNVTGALRRLGLAATPVGRIGRDPFGDVVEDLLGDEGGALERTDSAATSYSLVVHRPGEDRAFLHHPGANHDFGGEVLRAALQRLEPGPGSLLHFGYPPIMRAAFADGGRALADALGNAAERGVLVSLDMATPDPTGPAAAVDWRAFLARVLPNVSLFAPSWSDLAALLPDVPGTATTQAVRDAAVRFLTSGASAVLLKLGPHGAYLRSGDAARLPSGWRNRELWSPNFVVDARGTTGAGDATIAGMLAGIATGADAPTALTLASATGAASVAQRDGSSAVPTLDALNDRLATGWPRAAAPLAEGRPDSATGLIHGPEDGTGDRS